MSKNVYAGKRLNEKILEDAKQNKYAYDEEWNSIPWNKIEHSIHKLQCDIASSEIEEDYRKERNLQRLLLSKDGLIFYAIKNVTMFSNDCMIPGTDKMIINSDSERMALYNFIKSVNIKDYNPVPMSIVRPKKKNKRQTVTMPTIIDRVYQTMIRLALEPRVEVNFEPTSYGFRPLRNAGNAVARIYQYTRKGRKPWIFEGDFSSGFDTLNHDWILDQLGNFPGKILISKWLKAGYVHSNMFDMTDRRMLQGGIISPLLANVAMNGLDEALGITYEREKIRNTVTYINQSTKYAMIRYAGDFVVLCNTKENAEEVYSLMEPYLEERGLTLTEDNTSITPLTDGFDFLGFNIREFQTQQGKKVLCRPSKDTLKRFRIRIKSIFIKYRSKGNIEMLIKELNDLLIHTAGYWRQSSAEKAFKDIDYYVWKLTSKFLRRQHPNKSWGWIKEKYLKKDCHNKNRNAYILTSPDHPEIQLVRMADTPIKYAKTIKHNCNPYESEYKNYIKKAFNQTPFEYLYR